MKLLETWKDDLKTAWSMYGAYFTAILAVADQLIAPFQGHLPPMVYAGLMGAIVFLRILDQKK